MGLVQGLGQKLVIFPDFDLREGGLVQGFRQKLVVFPNVYFREIRPEKCFYHILQGRNAFLHYKNKKLKKSKNWDCSKRVSPWF